MIVLPQNSTAKRNTNASNINTADSGDKIILNDHQNRHSLLFAE